MKAFWDVVNWDEVSVQASAKK
ncbi:hypothetical protein QM150_00595 [Klebsiella pneumoniae]